MSYDTSTTHSIDSRVTDIVLELVPRRLKTNATALGAATLADLGFDSMAKIALAFRLEQEFGIHLAHLSENIAEVRTVADVVRLMKTAAGHGS